MTLSTMTLSTMTLSHHDPEHVHERVTPHTSHSPLATPPTLRIPNSSLPTFRIPHATRHPSHASAACLALGRIRCSRRKI